MLHTCTHNEQEGCRQIITTCEMNQNAKKFIINKLTGQVNKRYINFNVHTSPTVKSKNEGKKLYSNIPHRYFPVVENYNQVAENIS